MATTVRNSVAVPHANQARVWNGVTSSRGKNILSIEDQMSVPRPMMNKAQADIDARVLNMFDIPSPPIKIMARVYLP